MVRDHLADADADVAMVPVAAMPAGASADELQIPKRRSHTDRDSLCSEVRR
jgi:hypothetical protein